MSLLLHYVIKVEFCNSETKISPASFMFILQFGKFQKAHPKLPY